MASKRTHLVVIAGLVTSFLIGGFFVSSYPTMRMRWNIEALREWDGKDPELFEEFKQPIFDDPQTAIPILLHWVNSEDPTWPRAARLLANFFSRDDLDPAWKADLSPRLTARLAVGGTLGDIWNLQWIKMDGFKFELVDGKRNSTITFPPRVGISILGKDSPKTQGLTAGQLTLTNPGKTIPENVKISGGSRDGTSFSSILKKADETANGWVPEPWKTHLKDLSTKAAPHLDPEAVEENSKWAVQNCLEATQ